MGFEKGRPIKNLLYAITHPLVAARERPLLFLLGAGTGVYFLGSWHGMVAKSFGRFAQQS